MSKHLSTSFRCLALAAVLAAAHNAAAQSLCYKEELGPAMRCTSSYLPVEHWACRYMDLLIARGRLTGPDPMVQPYRRIDVARAIHEMECDPLSGSTRPIPNRCQSLWDGYS